MNVVFRFTAAYDGFHSPGMKPIVIENEYGETIEIKWDSEGAIQIRHSDIDKRKFGKFHEFSKRMRQPQVETFLKAKGIDPDSPEAKQVAGMLGGYVVLCGNTYLVNPAETALILDAV